MRVKDYLYSLSLLMTIVLHLLIITVIGWSRMPLAVKVSLRYNCEHSPSHLIEDDPVVGNEEREEDEEEEEEEAFPVGNTWKTSSGWHGHGGTGSRSSRAKGSCAMTMLLQYQHLILFSS